MHYHTGHVHIGLYACNFQDPNYTGGNISIMHLMNGENGKIIGALYILACCIFFQKK